MTLHDGFDRTVTAWLDEQAGRGAPGYLDEILARTTLIRQRPAWSSLERWLPVQTTLRFVPAPRGAWLLALLVLLLAVGLAAFIGSRPHEPEPFGVETNGLVAYGGSGSGDIYLLDPETGVSTAIVTGPTVDLAPLFSPDGTQLVFARVAPTAGQHVLVLANADGSGVRELSGPLSNLTGIAWSPDGSLVAVISDLDGRPALWALALDGSVTRLVDSGLRAEFVEWRPDGRELVFRGVTEGPAETYGLYRAGVDGTGLQPIVTPTGWGEDWQDPDLSPDGREILFTRWDADIGGRLFAVPVDGGELRRLEFAGPTGGDWGGYWSPDGTKIAFNRILLDEQQVVVGAATGGEVLEIGPAMAAFSGGTAMAWSPDGTRLLVRYASDGSFRLLDVAGGPGERIPASEFVGSWQGATP